MHEQGEKKWTQVSLNILIIFQKKSFGNTTTLKGDSSGGNGSNVFYHPPLLLFFLYPWHMRKNLSIFFYSPFHEDDYDLHQLHPPWNLSN